MKLVKLSYSALIIFLLLLIGYRHYDSYQREINRYQEYFIYYDFFSKNNSDYHNLTFLEKIKLKPIILKQISSLKNDGWKKEVIYRDYLTHLPLTNVNNSLDSTNINEIYLESRKIGSPLFLKLWHHQIINSEQENAKKNIQLILNILKFPEELKDDSNKVNKMLTMFDDNLRPTDQFWNEFSQQVAIAFPNSELSDTNTLAKQTHQLRYLFSLQEANWIRKFYKGKNDSDALALAKYLSTLTSEQYTLDEPARYHNKIAKGFNSNDDIIPIYPSYPDVTNFKILIHFHSEFILSAKNNFLIALDKNTEKKSAIVNSASFNYASDNNSLHEQIDIAPITFQDPQFITETINNHNIPFETASLKQQKSKSSNVFSRDGKSLKTLTKEVRETFNQLLNSINQKH